MQLNGASDPVVKEFSKQSVLAKKADQDEHYSRLDLDFTIQQDLLLLKNVLNAYGYLEHSIAYRVVGEKIVFDIQAGKAFIIRAIRMKECEAESDVCEGLISHLKLKPGHVLQYAKLNQAHEQLLDFFQNKGYINPHYKKPYILVHYDAKEVEIEFRVIPGQRMLFGDLLLSGLEKVKTSYIQNKVTWKKGDTFNKSVLEKFRTKLYETGLFSHISFKKHVHDSTGVVDIEVRLVEMPPRYIGASGYLRTGEGLGGQLEWHHLNLTGHGDELAARVTAFKYFKRAEIEYALPHFVTRKQKTYVSMNWEQSDRDAYESNLVTFYPYLKTKINKNLKIYTGIQYQIGKAKKTEGTFDTNQKRLITKKYPFDVSLISFPMSIVYDTTDHKFAPTKGLYAQLEGAPFLGKERQNFTKIEMAVSYLLPFSLKQREIPPFALLNKVSFGHLIGKDLDKIVPHQRFYLGGPETMRAYGLNLVGDLDDDKHPKGGKSYGYYVGECRVQVHEKITLNLFHEIGIVNQTGLSDLFKKNNKFFHGSGVTVCYYSPVLPIQIGLAVPWKRRKNYENKYIDDAFQFYVGIGQIR